MENENKVKNTDEVVAESTAASANVVVKDLMSSIENLPRTDHMTLPAISIVKLDEETAARMTAIAAINAATSGDTVINEEGKTLQQIRNEFNFGVTELTEKGAKHSFEVVENGVVVIAPEINGEQQESVTIVATPANIAPVDADAPHNPVEAKEMGEESSYNLTTPEKVIPISGKPATQEGVAGKSGGIGTTSGTGTTGTGGTSGTGGTGGTSGSV